MFECLNCAHKKWSEVIELAGDISVTLKVTLQVEQVAISIKEILNLRSIVILAVNAFKASSS